MPGPGGLTQKALSDARHNNYRLAAAAFISQPSRSLAANDLRGWNIFIQLEPSEFVEDFRTAAAEILSATPTSIVVNAERLGVRLNPYRLLSRVFNEGADLVLYLEEDLLLSDDVTALALWYANNHRPEWMSLPC